MTCMWAQEGECGIKGCAGCEYGGAGPNPVTVSMTPNERKLLAHMEFYRWGGGHWCSERDFGDTCYDDKWAVEQALEWAREDGLNACANCPDYWPALPGDYLCHQCRNEIQ